MGNYRALAKRLERLLPGVIWSLALKGRRTAYVVMRRMLTRLRGVAYAESNARWLSIMPESFTLRAGLRVPAGQRRLEIGSGGQPTPGFIHVEVTPTSKDVDLLISPGDRLPVPDGWADEILAVHMIEHVHPVALESTLGDWRRALRPGGLLTIHTPNGRALARALLAEGSDEATIWAVQNAMYGYGQGPHVSTPSELAGEPDHRMLFTAPLLEVQLARAGFTGVRDVSGTVECTHAASWDPIVAGLCLEIRAVAPADPQR